jgi:hypothetical protein
VSRIQISQCVFCKHLDTKRPGSFCTAFPDGAGIPLAVLISEIDHRRPVEGDHGVRFDPVDQFGAGVVADLFDGS